jgi:hypothetical protein
VEVIEPAVSERAEEKWLPGEAKKCAANCLMRKGTAAREMLAVPPSVPP